ncbi:MAG: hypothetical protein EAX86_02380 [Candidatus Heimdallarchaeota archaeon]|nr:hypothetical protein [Candidatus Heimdallarchaeota archaeon]
MSENNLLLRLEKINFQITPSALQVLENSHIPAKEIIKDIKKYWKSDKKVITVKEAVDFMLESSKFSKIAKEVKQEIKTRKKPEEMPKKLFKTYNMLKKLNHEITAGEVARYTRRKGKTELIYLYELVELGYVEKIRFEDRKPRFKIR